MASTGNPLAPIFLIGNNYTACRIMNVIFGYLGKRCVADQLALVTIYNPNTPV